MGRWFAEVLMSFKWISLFRRNYSFILIANDMTLLKITQYVSHFKSTFSFVRDFIYDTSIFYRVAICYPGQTWGIIYCGFFGSFVNIIYYRFFNIMKYMNVFNLSLSLSYIRVYDKKLIIHLLNVLHCNQVVSI